MKMLVSTYYINHPILTFLSIAIFCIILSGLLTYFIDEEAPKSFEEAIRIGIKRGFDKFFEKRAKEFREKQAIEKIRKLQEKLKQNENE